MQPADHAESFTVLLTKEDLEQALRCKYPFLEPFRLDDIDVTQGTPQEYARCFFTRDLGPL